MDHHGQQSQRPSSRLPEQAVRHNLNRQPPPPQPPSFPSFPPPPVSQAPVHIPFSTDPFSRCDPFISSSQNNRRDSYGYQSRDAGSNTPSERGVWTNTPGEPKNYGLHFAAQQQSCGLRKYQQSPHAHYECSPIETGPRRSSLTFPTFLHPIYLSLWYHNYGPGLSWNLKGLLQRSSSGLVTWQLLRASSLVVIQGKPWAKAG